MIQEITCPGEVQGRRCNADVWHLVGYRVKEQDGLQRLRVVCPVCGNAIVVEVRGKAEWVMTQATAIVEEGT